MRNNSQNIVVENQANTNDYADNVILHLSDLHFRKYANETENAKFQNIRKELIEKIRACPPAWKPNIVCITGDISDKNQKDGYDLAKIFIEQLLFDLDISVKNLVICPGNHDLDCNKADSIYYPKNSDDASKKFVIPIATYYEKLFSKYKDFCESLHLEKCKYGTHSSHLFGIKSIGDIDFIICNSCWFYAKAAPKKRGLRWLLSRLLKKNIDEYKTKVMWIGLPLLEYLENKHNLSQIKQSQLKKTIALVHHPERDLSLEETFRYDKADFSAAAAYLAERTDLVLTGHQHGLPLGKIGFATTDSINCGRNSFCLIKVENTHWSYISYILDLTKPDNRWKEDKKDENILFLTGRIFLNTFIEQGNSLFSLKNLPADSACLIPKPNQPGSDNTTPVALESTASKVPKFSETEIKSSIDEINSLIIKAKKYINKLELPKAFKCADEIENMLVVMELRLPNEFLSDIYVFLAKIEFDRTNWLSARKGLPKDYTRVKEFYEKAKNVNKKQ